MPFNLGALAGGAAEGLGRGTNFATQQENLRFLRDQRQLADDASKIWGRTVAQMGGAPQAPMAQPPMPGQPSMPTLQPPQPMMAGSQGAPLPQSMNGVPYPVPKPPEFGGAGVPQPAPAPPMPQQTQMQPPQAPQQPQTMGGGMGQLSGQMGLTDTLQRIMRANPELDPNNPRDMRALVGAAGQALPFMKQADQEYYRQLTLALQQQRADTSRDQGWERIRQSAERLANSAETHQSNLALNQERLMQARANGDTRYANLIERQIENDRKALTGYTNAYTRLLQSTTPSQREDPAIAADLATLQERIQGLKNEPAALEHRNIRKGEAPAKEKSEPRHEDAAPKAPQEYPKVGQVVNGYKLVKPDFTKEDSWIYVGAGTPEVPKVGERPEISGGG